MPILFALWGAIGSVHADSPICFSEQTLAEIVGLARPLKPEEIPNWRIHENYQPPRDPVVTIVDRTPAPEGGHFIRLRNKGEGWMTTYKKYKAAPEGDPMDFPRFMGPVVGDFFGFRYLSKTELIVPDVHHFNAKLDQVNAALKKKGLEPLPIRFFESRPDDQGQLKGYLKKFADEGQIPWANEGSLFLHDIGFHLTSIALPPSAVRAAREHTQLRIRFAEYLDKRALLEPELEWIHLDKIPKRLLETRVTELDLMGAIGMQEQSLNHGSDFFKAVTREQSGEIFYNFTVADNNPLDALRKTLSTDRTHAAPTHTRNQLKEVLKNPSRWKTLERLVGEFAAEEYGLKQLPPLTTIMEENMTYNRKHRATLEELKRRRLEIEEVVTSLKSKASATD